MVGPKCPVLADTSSVRLSRGSNTAWLMICPRKCGPFMRHVLRAVSPRMIHSPLRVAMNKASLPGLVDWAALRLVRLTDFLRARVMVRLLVMDAISFNQQLAD